MDVRHTPLRFRRVRLSTRGGYWTFKDIWFRPYLWIDEKDVDKLPLPFAVFGLHYDCPVGRPGPDDDALTNIIPLPESRDGLVLKPDLRKDLKRIGKLNPDVRLVDNDGQDLDKASQWFVQQFKEGVRDLKNRLELWKSEGRWIAGYAGEELLGVHITVEDETTIYYMGCWWNREHRKRSVPTYLLHQDVLRAIDEGKQFYDLGIGDEPYKKKWPVIEKMSKYYAKVDEGTMKLLGFKRDEVELY